MINDNRGPGKRWFEGLVGSAFATVKQSFRNKSAPPAVAPDLEELARSVTKKKRGRPRKHKDNAVKQKAYRDRKRPEPKPPPQPPYGSESLKDWNTYLARVEKLSVSRGKFMRDAPQGMGLLIYGHDYQEPGGTSSVDREDAEEIYQGQPNWDDRMPNSYYYEERPDADDLPDDD